MSIWTDLLIFHGHVATPSALALIATTPRAPARDARRDPPRRPEAETTGRATPNEHPLRAAGQLR